MAVEALVGKVPDDWEYTTLGEACAGDGGNIQTGPFGSQLHASDYVTSGIPSIMPQNIGDNRVHPEGIARITQQDAERLSRYRVRPWDIVYSRRGDVEKRALIQPSEDGWLCGTGCLRVRFGVGRISPIYASYYLGDPRVREWLVRHAHGATMPNLNTGILSKLPFVIPPTDQQKVIAKILGSLDDKIRLNRQMNETLEDMARVLFQSWFVDFDPVCAKAEGRNADFPMAMADLFPDSFKDSELGKIPATWRIKTAGEVAERIAMGPFGSSIKVETFVDAGIPVISGQHLRTFMLSDTKFNFITEEHAKRLSKAMVKRGDVVFTHAGNIGQVAFIPDESRYESYVISQRQFYMRCDPQQVSPLFVAFYFSSEQGQHQLLANTSSSGVPSIARPVSYLRSVQLPLPPRNILAEFDRLIRPALSRFRLNRDDCDTLSNIRDALLPRLISGKLRIPDAERIVGAKV
jgi:type I restriction enzyme S subunit